MSRRIEITLTVFVSICGLMLLVPAGRAQAQNKSAREEAIQKAAAYLRTHGQTEDGAFSKQSGPGVTALVATALLRSGLTPEDPLVAKSLKYLEGMVHPDGGIYAEGSRHRNYETCIAMLAFVEANTDGRYKDLLKNAEKFVKGLQWDETKQIDKANLNYGGAGYGGERGSRPDLSNTTYLIDALRAVGCSPDDEAIQKAIVFVSRCQNLESEYNATPFATKVNDGGFYYTVAGGGSSFAGKTDEGGLRSYGSMTYAGFKSMVYAGLDKNDPRVKAAYDWIRSNYDVKSNPGMGDSGLYYYYHTFSKALQALDSKTVDDTAGKSHDWRKDLETELLARQNPDGSWVNQNQRWLEGDPNLATAFALLSLSYIHEGENARQ